MNFTRKRIKIKNVTYWYRREKREHLRVDNLLKEQSCVIFLQSLRLSFLDPANHLELQMYFRESITFCIVVIAP